MSDTELATQSQAVVPTPSKHETLVRQLVLELGSVDYDQWRLTQEYNRANEEFEDRRTQLRAKIQALIEANHRVGQSK